MATLKPRYAFSTGNADATDDQNNVSIITSSAATLLILRTLFLPVCFHSHIIAAASAADISRFGVVLFTSHPATGTQLVYGTATGSADAGGKEPASDARRRSVATLPDRVLLLHDRTQPGRVAGSWRGGNEQRSASRSSQTQRAGIKPFKRRPQADNLLM